jgi:hypothetical protein
VERTGDERSREETKRKGEKVINFTFINLDIGMFTSFCSSSFFLTTYKEIQCLDFSEVST